MYIEKIQNLINNINASNSPYQSDDLSFISSLYESCATYIQAVMLTETCRMALRTTFNTPADYQTYFEAKDKARSGCHNLAMSNIKMINKICASYDNEPIFTEKELALERIEMADQIIKPLVIELFEARVL